MIDTKDSIIKGCKFILNLGAVKWDTSLNRRAIERMRDLCQLQLDDWTVLEKPKEFTVDQLSDEEIKGVFNENN